MWFFTKLLAFDCISRRDRSMPQLLKAERFYHRLMPVVLIVLIRLGQKNL